jgi:uncharacterized membrane protein YqaE (UPF0057 family)
MKSNTKIEVPAVAWWVLIALFIPPLQVWIARTFPGSAYAWAPLVVAVLGAVLKWISWIMEQNNQDVPGAPEEDGEDILAPASLQAVFTDEDGNVVGEGPAYMLDYQEPPAKKFDAADFFLGIKRG